MAGNNNTPLRRSLRQAQINADKSDTNTDSEGWTTVTPKKKKVSSPQEKKETGQFLRRQPTRSGRGELSPNSRRSHEQARARHGRGPGAGRGAVSRRTRLAQLQSLDSKPRSQKQQMKLVTPGKGQKSPWQKIQANPWNKKDVGGKSDTFSLEQTDKRNVEGTQDLKKQGKEVLSTDEGKKIDQKSDEQEEVLNKNLFPEEQKNQSHPHFISQESIIQNSEIGDLTEDTKENSSDEEQRGDYEVEKYNQNGDNSSPESKGSSKLDTSTSSSSSSDTSQSTLAPSTPESSSSSSSNDSVSPPENKNTSPKVLKLSKEEKSPMQTIEEDMEDTGFPNADVSREESQKDDLSRERSLSRGSTNSEYQYNNNSMKPVENFFNPIVSQNSSGSSNQEIPGEFNSEEQDEIDTIASDQTSHYNNRDSNKQTPPPFIRYQFGIAMKEVQRDLKKAEKEKEKENNKEKRKDKGSKKSKEQSEDEDEEEDSSSEASDSPATVFRSVFLQIASYLYSCDKEAQFVSWNTEETFSLLPVDPAKFPSDIVEISNYIDGYKSKIRPAIRNYFRFSLYSPNLPMKMMKEKLLKWADIHNIAMTKCIIQSEQAQCIGWLTYTNSYTDSEAIKRMMTSITNHEWGFRYQSITKTDKEADWKTRTKALAVFVPASKADPASSIISEVFHLRDDNQLKNRSLKDCYLFVPPEHTLSDEDSASIFSEMLNRHRYHCSAQKAQIVTFINSSLNRSIMLHDKTRVTLSEMILNIPIPDPDLDHIHLFRSVDFVPDTGKIWINGMKGPGGPGHVFTFYDWVNTEALQTIKGLGIYLAHFYGKTDTYKFFNRDHWQATKKWKWIPEEMCFDTPENRHLAANILNDPMVEMMQLNKRSDEDYNDKEQGKKVDKDAPLTIQQLAEKDLIHSEEEEEKNEDITQKATKAAEKLARATQHGRRAEGMNEYGNLSYEDHSHHSTFTDLERREARKVLEQRVDRDEDSFYREGDTAKQIHSVHFKNREETMSAASSLTNNTGLHSDQNSFLNTDDEASKSTAASASSKISFNSIRTTDLEKSLQAGMSMEEIDQQLTAHVLHLQRQMVIKKNNIRKKMQDAKERVGSSTLEVTPNQDHNILGTDHGEEATKGMNIFSPNKGEPPNNGQSSPSMSSNRESSRTVDDSDHQEENSQELPANSSDVGEAP